MYVADSEDFLWQMKEKEKKNSFNQEVRTVNCSDFTILPKSSITTAFLPTLHGSILTIQYSNSVWFDLVW